MGNFVITVTPPLQVGQIIYATDGCFDPLMVGKDTLVGPKAEAPLMGRPMLAIQIAVLSAAALWKLWRGGAGAAAAILVATGAALLKRLLTLAAQRTKRISSTCDCSTFGRRSFAETFRFDWTGCAGAGH